MIELEVGGRAVAITHPERVLWPSIGWTKRELIAYLRAIAPAILPHLRGRVVTLARFPEGVGGPGFFQTNCPKGAPPWVRTFAFTSPAGKPLRMCLVDDAATLVWTANLATIELHPFLASIERPDAPHALVFDLDPRAPAGLVECARIALDLRARLDALGLQAFPKISGAKGIHVYVPITGATYAQTKPLARAIAAQMTATDPSHVTDRMAKAGHAERCSSTGARTIR